MGRLEAKRNSLVTFGVVPERPETGYGFIEVKSDPFSAVKHVVGFREKPDLQTAEAMLKDCNHLW